jgi:hypothetical protein
VIADDEERTRRARAAMGTHRVMVAMLLTAQRELDEVRARAEREAAAILADAQRPVHVLDLTRPEPPAPSTTSPPVADVWPATVTETRMPTPVASNPVPAVHEGESNEYFDFLRGALDDHEPLGPRPESA